VFYEALDALGKMSNETERDAIAMEIFGRSAMELNPLIKAGAEEIANLSKEAHEVGAVMSEDNVAAMEEFGDTLASLKLGLQGTLGTLAGAFLPGFKGLAGKAQGYLKEFSGVVKGADGDLGKMAVGIGDLAGKIAADVAQSAPQMMQAGLSIVMGIVKSIVKSIPALIPAAVEMITSLIKFIADSLPMLTQAAVDLVLALVNGILPQLPMLIETAVQMILTLANGLTDALPQLIPAVAEIIPLIIIALVGALPLLIDAALQLVVALIDGLGKAMPVLSKYVPTILETVYNALFESLPIIATAAVDVVMTLVDGIIGSLPTIASASVELIGVFIDGIEGMGNVILQVGVNIVTGIWEGIRSRWDWFGQQIRGFFSNIISSVKAELGIRSPSRVFGDIGENMALGLGKGFLGSFGDIERQITGAVNGMQFSPSLAAAGGSGFNGMNYSFGNIYVDARGATDPQRVSVAVKDGVLSALRSRGA
jgi:phage-related protein